MIGPSLLLLLVLVIALVSLALLRRQFEQSIT